MSSEIKFWESIRGEYELSSDFLNLENGYYCVMPKRILNDYIKNIQEVNRLGSYYMRTVQFETKDDIAAILARELGAKDSELILTRNTTESIFTIINGMNWSSGDEVVLSKYDYGSVLDMFRYLEETKKVGRKIIGSPFHTISDQQIVRLYEEKITDNTRLLVLPHIIHLTGQIMPIKGVVEMAHSYGVQVLVDGAHATGHIKVSLEDLQCDYYAASLHKWFSAPLGSGILFIKEKLIPDISPTVADYSFKSYDIRKLNHTGTHPVDRDLTIKSAVQFYHDIGSEKKERRLRELTSFWIERIRHLEQVTFNTPIDTSNRYCAIANFGIKSIKPHVLQKILFDQYKIWTVAIDEELVKGIRVTPNIYTSFEDLDRLVLAISKIHATL